MKPLTDAEFKCHPRLETKCITKQIRQMCEDEAYKEVSVV